MTKLFKIIFLLLLSQLFFFYLVGQGVKELDNDIIKEKDFIINRKY